jgi:16S rRNA (cytosine1402-N4)-methyltransferase
MSYHNSVLLFESIDGLDIRTNGIYVDVTFGGGGHSKEILKRLGPEGRLYAFDQDEDALENTIDDSRFTLIHQNFRFINRFLKAYGIDQVDGILADLGVSSHQFDIAERGFSTRFDAALDMRMSKSTDTSAFDVINSFKEAKLREILFMYGELKNAKAMAIQIVSSRKIKPIKTSFELKAVLSQFLPKNKEHKILAQVFQAIRIEVNQELNYLKEFLIQTEELLKKGGKLSVISYHSLEDRLVKRFMRSGLFEGDPEKDFYGNQKIPFKKEKLIIPSLEEIKLNNRSRSAKLRIATKL